MIKPLSEPVMTKVINVFTVRPEKMVNILETVFCIFYKVAGYGHVKTTPIVRI